MAVNAGDRVRAAAVRLFAEKGFHGVGIRELAQSAELSSASLYHYMGTKEALLVQIMDDCLARLTSAAERAITDLHDPARTLVRLVTLHVLAHALQARETTVVDNEIRSLSPERRRPVIAQRDAYEGLWASTIAQGAEAGVFRPDDPAVARRALLEMCSGVARWYSPNGPLSLDALAERYARLALRALGAPDVVLPSDLEHCRTIVAEVWG